MALLNAIPVVFGSPPEGVDSGIEIKLCNEGISVRGMDSNAVKEWQKRTGHTLYIGIRNDGDTDPSLEIAAPDPEFTAGFSESAGNPWRDKYEVVTGPTLGPNEVEPQPVIVEGVK